LTIIDDHGNFWTESHLLTIILEDASGRYFTGVTNLDRQGNFMGGTIMGVGMANNDNSEAVGSHEIRDQISAALTIGKPITGISLRVNKQTGTAGSTAQTFNVLVFLRK